MKNILIVLLSLMILSACAEDNGTAPPEDFTKIAFIYQPSATHKDQTDFMTFLTGRGYVFQAFTMDQVATADFSSYHLIIIDSWIGSGNDWVR